MLVVDLLHHGPSFRCHATVSEEINGLVRGNRCTATTLLLMALVDVLMDDVFELPNEHCTRHQELFLLDRGEVGAGRLLAYHRHPVRVLRPDSGRFTASAGGHFYKR